MEYRNTKIPFFKKNPWWKKDYKEGYYQDGKYFNPDWDSGTYKQLSSINSREFSVIDGSVFTLPCLYIFVGEKVIHTEYFETNEDMELHVKQNYPKCSVTYN